MCKTNNGIPKHGHSNPHWEPESRAHFSYLPNDGLSLLQSHSVTDRISKCKTSVSPVCWLLGSHAAPKTTHNSTQHICWTPGASELVSRYTRSVKLRGAYANVFIHLEFIVRKGARWLFTQPRASMLLFFQFDPTGLRILRRGPRSGQSTSSCGGGRKDRRQLPERWTDKLAGGRVEKRNREMIYLLRAGTCLCLDVFVCDMAKSDDYAKDWRCVCVRWVVCG